VATEAFRGEFYQKVDSKARVSIPAAMRRILELANPAEGTRASVIMIYGAGGRHVQCYSPKGAQALYDMIAQHPIGKHKDDLELRFVSRSIEVEIDDDGRLVLPPKVRERMGVTPDILAGGFLAAFAGKIDRFELWMGDAYDAATAQFDKDEDPALIRAGLALPAT
jgi:MraZ protein